MAIADYAKQSHPSGRPGARARQQLRSCPYGLRPGPSGATSNCARIEAIKATPKPCTRVVRHSRRRHEVLVMALRGARFEVLVNDSRKDEQRLIRHVSSQERQLASQKHCTLCPNNDLYDIAFSMRLVMETQSGRSAAGPEPDVLQRLKLQPTKPTVFILSDVRLYREGLSWSLTREGSLEVAGASALSGTALESLAAQIPDAVIFDITMRDGLELARALHARLPETKIVALAVSDIDGEIMTGAMAGISGYVHRDGGIGELVAEVLNAVRGELHCSPQLAARLLAQIASLSFGEAGASKGTAADERRALTQRETEILVLVEQGLSNKEIARSCGGAADRKVTYTILPSLTYSRWIAASNPFRSRRRDCFASTSTAQKCATFKMLAPVSSWRAAM